MALRSWDLPFAHPSERHSPPSQRHSAETTPPQERLCDALLALRQRGLNGRINGLHITDEAGVKLSISEFSTQVVLRERERPIPNPNPNPNPNHNHNPNPNPDPNPNPNPDPHPHPGPSLTVRALQGLSQHGY